jgi:hypothetical protein
MFHNFHCSHCFPCHRVPSQWLEYSTVFHCFENILVSPCLPVMIQWSKCSIVVSLFWNTLVKFSEFSPTRAGSYCPRTRQNCQLCVKCKAFSFSPQVGGYRRLLTAAQLGENLLNMSSVKLKFYCSSIHNHDRMIGMFHCLLVVLKIPLLSHAIQWLIVLTYLWRYARGVYLGWVTTLYGPARCPKKLLKSLIVKIWMPYQKAERNDA